jgi:hypothetical protein
LASHQVAQRLVRRLLFESVPAVEGVPSRQQGLEFRVGAALAEHVSDVVEVVGQVFAGKLQRQRLAETELALIGNRDVVLIIRVFVRQLILELVNTGEFGAQVDLAGAPAQDRVIGAGIGASDEFERETDVLEAGRHGLALYSRDPVPGRDRRSRNNLPPNGPIGSSGAIKPR